MLMRYIGPAEEVQVTINGQDYGTVAQGESIPVPDDVVKAHSWADNLWEKGDKSANTNKDGK